MMGFGEYRHWSYGRMMREKPNYAAYVGMESERVAEPQKQFQEWIQKEKGHWSYLEKIEEGGNPLAKSKTMVGKRQIKRESSRGN